MCPSACPTEETGCPGFVSYPNGVNPLALMLGNFKASISDGKFLSGSNWLSVKRTGWEIVGIKTDGTLWVSEQPVQNKLHNGRWSNNQDEMFHLVKFGTETNWSSLSSYSVYTLLVKNDGTLWRWGATKFRLQAPAVARAANIHSAAVRNGIELGRGVSTVTTRPVFTRRMAPAGRPATGTPTARR